MSLRWVVGDATKLADLSLEGEYEPIHDRGCYHDLPELGRDAYATGVTSLAAPGATLLLMTFVPGAWRIGVASGASEDEIAQRFGHSWEIVSVQSDSGPAPPGPMKRVARVWYRLKRA